MMKNKIVSVAVTSTTVLMFVLLVALTYVASANAVDSNDMSVGNVDSTEMSPEQLQTILDSIGIDVQLDSLPLSSPSGGTNDLGTAGQMMSQPSDGDGVDQEDSEERTNTAEIDDNADDSQDENDDEQYEEE